MSGFTFRSLVQVSKTLCTVGCCLMLIASSAAVAAPVLVSFEAGEGYPGPGTLINSTGPYGPTTLWSVSGSNNFFVADAAAPDPGTNPGAAITGVQYAHSQSTGNGQHILTMDLDTTQNLLGLRTVRALSTNDTMAGNGSFTS